MINGVKVGIEYLKVMKKLQIKKQKKMSKQEKIKYYNRCINAYKNRGAIQSNKQKIRWYEDAIRILQKQND